MYGEHFSVTGSTMESLDNADRLPLIYGFLTEDSENVFSREYEEPLLTTNFCCKRPEEAIARWKFFHRLRVVLDISKLERLTYTGLSLILASQCPYRHMVLKVDNLASLVTSFDVLQRFKSTLQSVRYEGDVLSDLLNVQQMTSLLESVQHVEELHLGFNYDYQRREIKKRESIEDIQNSAYNLMFLPDVIPELPYIQQHMFSDEDNNSEAEQENSHQQQDVNCDKSEQSDNQEVYSPPPDLPRLEKLKWLSFGTSYLDVPWVKWSLIAPQVEHLFVPLQSTKSLEFYNLIVSRAHQLRSLGLVLGYNAFYYMEKLAKLDFPELTKLILVFVTPPCNLTMDASAILLRKMYKLEQLYLGEYIIPAVIDDFETRFHELTSLTLNGPSVPCHTFQTLSRLPNLKCLRLERLKLNHSVLDECQIYTKLTALELMSVSILSKMSFFHKLNAVMPFVKRLIIATLSDPDYIKLTTTIPYMAATMAGIEILTLSEWKQHAIDLYQLICLRSLPHLSELRLGFNILSVQSEDLADLEHMICPNIVKIVAHINKFFVNGAMVRITEAFSTITKIKQVYPNLQVFELADRCGFTITEREKLDIMFAPVTVQYNNAKLLDKTVYEHVTPSRGK